ncbi:unnamed protein product [Diabrotica balteata]|uniref:DUF659 domain-containing protein n=1 Tax=Diabrotica balteata TaxID=107213 RepID=A0A9N9T3H3_DIABA|nr:unnamed protein product [Diabrotica balteata]
MFAGGIAGYKPPTRKTLSGSLLQKCYIKTEQIIRSQVVKEVENICITTDLRTSEVTKSYIALTEQYLTENFEFKTVLLGCCHFSGNHNSENIAFGISEIINQWDLKRKVNFAVTDNASNMVKAVKDVLE